MFQSGEARLLGLFVRVFAAFVTGSVFSQSAEFTQQYVQRLGGAADELRIVVERFEDSAHQMKLSPEAAIERLRENSDRLAARQGEDAAATRARYREVARRYRLLAATDPLFRPLVMITDPDWTLVERTSDDYRPALPVTPDGLFLALAGFILGWGAGSGAHGAGRMVKKRRKARRRTDKAEPGQTSQA
ncbi:DUF2937 family protein [Aurantimonas sp. VKM B-3413]|uniref:DUF2937 family protein n=1 Tax=Aurantimonas sp. VKM B-3413 TaxID=2779401 RepID=UPI001E2F8E9D|nr:DUF2937 family protein [Aurantimonas sp. VKM B-3413]MCB8838710.1 DUF2937 family protein [Aurantimonas sp. VKM B-3413]